MFAYRRDGIGPRVTHCGFQGAFLARVDGVAQAAGSFWRGSLGRGQSVVVSCTQWVSARSGGGGGSVRRLMDGYAPPEDGQVQLARQPGPDCRISALKQDQRTPLSPLVLHVCNRVGGAFINHPSRPRAATPTPNEGAAHLSLSLHGPLPFFDYLLFLPN